MPQRITIPQDEIDKLMQEVNGMSESEVKELAGTYAKRLASTYNASPEAKAKTRLREAIRRKKMRLVVDRAIDLGLLEKKARGRSAAAS